VRDPGLAALLSFIIPGMGQLYNGKWGRAIFWFIVTPGLWLGTGGLLGWVAHIIAAATAHNYAKRHPYR
jgi:TM2 domain-containing membrane protein YozV